MDQTQYVCDKCGGKCTVEYVRFLPPEEKSKVAALPEGKRPIGLCSARDGCDGYCWPEGVRREWPQPTKTGGPIVDYLTQLLEGQARLERLILTRLVAHPPDREPVPVPAPIPAPIPSPKPWDSRKRTRRRGTRSRRKSPEDTNQPQTTGLYGCVFRSWERAPHPKTVEAVWLLVQGEYLRIRRSHFAPEVTPISYMNALNTMHSDGYLEVFPSATLPDTVITMTPKGLEAVKWYMEHLDAIRRTGHSKKARGGAA
jgi:hypothetical protein